MSESIVLQRREEDDVDVYGFYRYNAQLPDNRTDIEVKITPNRRRSHNSPPMDSQSKLCDRVEVVVSANQHPEECRDTISSEFEIPVTEPPRTPEQFAKLAQDVAGVTLAQANEIFGLY